MTDQHQAKGEHSIFDGCQQKEISSLQNTYFDSGQKNFLIFHEDLTFVWSDVDIYRFYSTQVTSLYISCRYHSANITFKSKSNIYIPFTCLKIFNFDPKTPASSSILSTCIKKCMPKLNASKMHQIITLYSLNCSTYTCIWYCIHTKELHFSFAYHIIKTLINDCILKFNLLLFVLLFSCF